VVSVELMAPDAQASPSSASKGPSSPKIKMNGLPETRKCDRPCSGHVFKDANKKNGPCSRSGPLCFDLPSGQAEQTAGWPDQVWGKIEEKLSGLTVSLQAMLSEDPVRGRVEGGIHDSFL
jgi:hypothetical protein